MTTQAADGRPVKSSNSEDEANRLTSEIFQHLKRIDDELKEPGESLELVLDVVRGELSAAHLLAGELVLLAEASSEVVGRVVSAAERDLSSALHGLKRKLTDPPPDPKSARGWVRSARNNLLRALEKWPDNP